MTPLLTGKRDQMLDDVVGRCAALGLDAALGAEQSKGTS